MPRFLSRLFAQIRRVFPAPARAAGAAAAAPSGAGISGPRASAAVPPVSTDALGGSRSGGADSGRQQHQSSSGSRASMIDEGHNTGSRGNDAHPPTEITPSAARSDRASADQQAGTMVPSAKAYTQMAGLIERIGNHLDAQAERSDRMITLLERLPEALDSLSAIRGDSQTLIRVVSEHLEGQIDRDEQLRSVLGDLSTNSGRQASVLELINQQLNQNQRTEAELVSTLSDFRETLKDMSATNARSITVLTELAQFGQRQQAEFTMVLQKNNRMMMILSAVSVCVSAGGLVVALIALMRVLGAA